MSKESHAYWEASCAYNKARDALRQDNSITDGQFVAKLSRAATARQAVEAAEKTWDKARKDEKQAKRDEKRRR